MRLRVACAASKAATSPRNLLRILMVPDDEVDGVSLYDIRSSNTFHRGTRSLSPFPTARASALWRKLIVERVPVSLVEIARMICTASGGNGNAASNSSFGVLLTQGMRFL